MSFINWNSVIWKVLTVYGHWLLIVAIIWAAKFSVAYSQRNSEVAASNRKKIVGYLLCVPVALGITLFFTESLGSHTETDGDESYTVRDYYPSEKQKWNYAAKVFLVVLPTGLLGLYLGFNEDKQLTPEERRKKNEELNKPPKDDW